MERSPLLRSDALNSILSTLTSPSGSDLTIEARRVIGSMWIAGEFASNQQQVEAVLSTFERAIGDIPLLQQELLIEQQNLNSEQVVLSSNTTDTKTKVKVLADGTYASETAMSSSSVKDASTQSEPVIKTLLKKGYFEVGAVLSITLTKIVCHSCNIKENNRLKARAMLLMTGIVRFGLSKFPETPIDRDSYDRIMFTLRSLNTPSSLIQLESMFKVCRKAFESQQKNFDYSVSNVSTQIDSPLTFQILPSTNLSKSSKKRAGSDIEEAINGSFANQSMTNMLSRVVQLTGFSDTLYAETYVTMHQSDIFLDILLVNQLEETLQDVSIDIAVSGDLKVIENPPPHIFGPLSFATLKAVVKVCSTCTGTIYGSISYGMSGEEQSIVLLPISVDVLDFVRPESITDSAFRSQWMLLEWENKINIDVSKVHKTCGQVYSFLAEKMRLLPIGQIPSDADYLAGNLYAKTIFGEEVLVNICLESGGEGHITGHLRLRSRSQGVAVSLGDRMLCLLKPFK